ncbi:hemolysin family protein [Planococcus glaciei]|uniref:hemolysin family protein n=1 Tax=Planococcus glaciei TaxID=459472 RepID=UPI001F3AD3A5|nr:hemolysin family protein [Planococcus glaciei]
MDIPIRLTAIAVFLAATAFFSASEFAIVKVRISRIDALFADRSKRAIAAKKVMSGMDNYLCLCQIGLTASILGVGWLGYGLAKQFTLPIVMHVGFSPGTAETVSMVLTFMSIAFLLIVAGALVPKSIAAQQAEKILLANARWLVWCSKLLFVFIPLFQGSVRFITGMSGVQRMSADSAAHTEEELKRLLSDSLKNGDSNALKYAYAHKLYEFESLNAKDIMVPRTAMTTIEKDTSLKQAIQFVQNEQFTRYPITDGDKDHIVGVVNMKHLLTAFIQDPANGQLPVGIFALPVIQVIDASKASELLLKMQHERIHMAILRDEYGGTSGLVTIEDILEEIVGDIQDEFDTDEIPEVQQLGEGHYIFDAKLLIDHINNLLGIDIADKDIDTIGGWFMAKSFDTIKGQKISEQNYDFLAKEIDGHQLLYLEVQRRK